MIKKYFTFIFLVLLLLQFSLVIAESGSTQNVVNTASAQVTPPAAEYTLKTSEAGFPQLYDSNKNLVARGDEHFQLTESKGKITFKDNGAGLAGEKLEFGNFAKDQTFEVSKTDMFSEVTYDPIKNSLLLNEKSTADVYAGATELKQITNAKITMSEEGGIDFAEFTSKKGGAYTFFYNEKQYVINANAGDKVVFDPKNNKITGSSTSGKEMNFGLDEEGKLGPSLPERKGSVNAKDFEIILDENGKIKEVNLINGGTYHDKENKLDYSSKERFSVFYDGKEIKEYQGNAVSVFSDEEGLSIQAKGLVNVNDLDKKIVYSGKTAGVYSEYDYDNSYFDVQAGESSVSNGKHKVDIKEGLAINNDNLEYSGKEASSFSVGYSKDGNNKESLLVNYLEKDGKIQTEATYFKDGKENIVDLSNLADQEARYIERARLPTKADIDRAIFYLDKNDHSYQKKLADLYATKGLMSEQELSSYKLGQEVFEVRGTGLTRIGTLKGIDANGNYLIEGYTGGVYTKAQLDNFVVSKLTFGEVFGKGQIVGIEYSKDNGQITYTLQSLDKPDVRAYLTEKELTQTYLSEDYKTAISYYKEAQKNPQLAGEASLSLASVYQQMGYTESAKGIYRTLLDSEDTSIKTLAYKGLISNYFKENNPTAALQSLYKASEYNPNDVSLAGLNKQLTKNYLETINSAINLEDADILGKWKEKVGFGDKWYNVGLDQPIVSWFKEDINFATGFSRDQLSEQQKGILVMENLIDRGYSLKEIQGMSGGQIKDIFKINGAEAVSMTNAIRVAFENSDVQNLANGAEQVFNFETGKGYVDKQFIEKGLSEKILSGVNTKNVAIYLATEGIGYGVGAARGAELASSTGVGLTASTGFWTKSRYVADIFQEGTTPYYVTKALTSDVFLELPANLKQLSSHLETQSLIRGLAPEAKLGTASLANTRITSLEFDDMASVKSFINTKVVGSADEGVRIVSMDKSTGQYLLELNGQNFLTRVAGNEISPIYSMPELAYAPTVRDISAVQQLSRDFSMRPSNAVIVTPSEPISPVALTRLQEMDNVLANSPESLKVVLVGASDYKYVTPLKGSITDIDGMGAYFSGQGVPSANIVRMENPTSADFLTNLKSTLQNFQPGEKVTLYYAGHMREVMPSGEVAITGLQRDIAAISTEKSGLEPGYYFALTDATEGGAGMISAKEIGDLLSSSKVEATVILDSCHSGGACNLMVSESEKGLFIASAKSSQQALEIPQLNDEGLFTGSFLDPSRVKRNFPVATSEIDLENLEQLSFSKRIQFASEATPSIAAKNFHDQQVEVLARGLSSEDSYASGQLLLNSIDDTQRALDLRKDKFLFEAVTEKFALYSPNKEVAGNDVQLFRRTWKTIASPTTYEGLRDYANVGRAFSIDGQHLQNGKVIIYDQSAEGKFIWTLDQKGNMNVGLRSEASAYKYISGGNPEDKILPHPALAGGENVFGAGEIVFKDGVVIEVNAWSGHYVDLMASKEFNANTIKAFRAYADSIGLKLSPDIKFVTTSPTATP